MDYIGIYLSSNLGWGGINHESLTFYILLNRILEY